MKKLVTLFSLTACALVLFTACGKALVKSDGGDSTAYQKISADDAKELLEAGTTFTLVDVRRVDEYEAAHIPSAVNVPNESIGSTQPDELPNLNQTIVVYCRTGVRSKQAADKLVAMGYTDVRDMGGIVSWQYDTVSGENPGDYAKQD